MHLHTRDVAALTACHPHCSQHSRVGKPPQVHQYILGCGSPCTPPTRSPPLGCSLHPHPLCPGNLPGKGQWSHRATLVLLPLHALSPNIQILYTSFLLIFKKLLKVSVQLPAVIFLFSATASAN